MRRVLALVLGAAAAAAPAAARVAAGRGTISTVATLSPPRGLAVLGDGSFLVAEPFRNVVQRVAPDGTVTTVAGTGTSGFSGDGGPATAAGLDFRHGGAAAPGGGFGLPATRNRRVTRALSP